MRNFFCAFAMCQSMFCAIPFPCHVWEEKARSKMLLFLPLIGLEIGAIWAAAGWLCRWLGLNPLVTGLVLTVVPFLLTGFIHLDGFMDVTDAVGSCRDLDKRRAILKDSHVGSFAVIGCILLMLSQFALCASLDVNLWVLILIPAISRCCSAIAVSTLPTMSTSQYSGQKKNIGNLVFLWSLLALLLILGFVCFGKLGFGCVGCAVGHALALRKGYRSLQGMNGDISGYSLTIGELAAVAVLAVL